MSAAQRLRLRPMHQTLLKAKNPVEEQEEQEDQEDQEDQEEQEDQEDQEKQKEEANSSPKKVGSYSG